MRQIFSGNGAPSLSRIIKAAALALLLTCALPLSTHAEQTSFNLLCRPELSSVNRDQLANRLRAITGWNDLRFDDNGALRLGQTQTFGGSSTARALLTAAVDGKNLIVLEDASQRADVVFCRVVEGRWTQGAANRPPVFLVLIDFADFSHLMGDDATLAAFNVGWGALHEIDHVVHDSIDTPRADEPGDCEETINRMRRECGLAERAEYFFNFQPGLTESAFMTKLVRMAFDETQPSTNKKKRHWLLWDASLVGGLEEHRQLSARM